MKFCYVVQIFHESMCMWKSCEVEAKSDKQALKLAAIQNPGWFAKRILYMKVVQ